MHDFMCKQEKGFAWNDQERGRFRTDFFPPVDFPTIPHTPWIQKNIAIPPGIYDEVCRIIRKKIDAGVYERSNSSYRSRWFCVLKKDGKSLRPVHSLEPLLFSIQVLLQSQNIWQSNLVVVPVALC